MVWLMGTFSWKNNNYPDLRIPMGYLFPLAFSGSVPYQNQSLHYFFTNKYVITIDWCTQQVH